MKTRVRWSVVLCSLALLAVTGCGTLQDMGISSRGARMYREEQARAARLEAQNAELQSLVVASKSAQDEMKKAHEAELAKLKTATPPPGPDRPSVDERWAKLIAALKGQATWLVTDKGHRALRLTGDILFRSGKVDVKGDADSVLTTIAGAIKGFDSGLVVFVDGHTDADPLRYTKAKYGDNYGLGAARAKAVAVKLTALGVPSTQLVTRSFGPDKPIADNKTNAGKKQNRRVEFIFAFAADAGRISMGGE